MSNESAPATTAAITDLTLAEKAAPVDHDAHHDLAREAAARSIVLLKNDGGLLPLRTDQSMALIGEFARTPRFQGAGSSLVSPTQVDTVRDAIGAHTGAAVRFAPGFSLEDPTADETLRANAVAAARASDVTLVMLGLPPEAESESFDRVDLDLPDVQRRLLDEILAVTEDVVVVLSHGGAVTLPFRNRVRAILDASLLGQSGGSATADVLFGSVNPSGKLTETIPLRVEDTPAYGNFPGEAGHVRYGEGIFVGYRWYDHRNLDVAYPFGHGLSYTTFAYGEVDAAIDAGDIVVSVEVTNTGPVAGRESVQVYIAVPDSRISRPPRELKGFGSITLEPGAAGRVTMRIPRGDLASWDVRKNGWSIESAIYRFDVGASSRDIRGSVSIDVDGDAPAPPARDATLGELLAHPVFGSYLRSMLGPLVADGSSLRMLESLPVRRLGALTGLPIDDAQLAARLGG